MPKAIRYLIPEIAVGLLLWASMTALAQPFNVPAPPAIMPPLEPPQPPPLPDIVTPQLQQQQQDILNQQITAGQAEQFAMWAQQNMERSLQQAEEHSDRAWTQLVALEANETARIARLHTLSPDRGARPPPLEPIVPAMPEHTRPSPERERPPTTTEWSNAAREAARVAAETRGLAEQNAREAQRAMETARSLREQGMHEAALRQLEASSRLEDHARFEREIAQRARDLATSDRNMLKNPALEPISRSPPNIVFPQGYQPSIVSPIPQPRWR
jgi:hypothetical protein